MAIELRRRSWTVDEYDRMIAAGVFHPDDRCELIDGEIIEMSPIGGRHAQCVDRLTAVLAGAAGGRAVIRVQGPVRVSDRSEPQPDLSVLAWRDDFYRTHPTPAEVLVLIEVADTSARFDRRIKMPLYAGAGIAEAWLVDVSGRRDADHFVEVHSGPTPEGFATTRTVRAGARLDVPGLPGVAVDVAALLA